MSCCGGKSECGEKAKASTSCCAEGDANTIEEVKEYYGKVLSVTDDLKTNACKTGGRPPKDIRAALSLIHDEVMSKFYGCGLTVPSDRVLEGLRILDLGSGSGRDCYVLSKLVGPTGYVVGIDMTKEQVDVAAKHIQFHQEAFGYEKPNVEFIHGYIEDLAAAGIPDNSFDLIISNCVVNLSPDKEAVFAGAFRALKPGGEIYFSDVYSDRRVPEKLRKDKVLWGECLSGALYWNDFLRVARKCGFTDPRLVECSPITIENETVEGLIGHVTFHSATYRLFKIAELEDSCENFGQAVRYKGTVAASPKVLTLDAHHTFEAGRVQEVCGNTYRMLADTRLRAHFEFFGSWETHYGIFPGCGESSPFAGSSSGAASSSGGGGCC